MVTIGILDLFPGLLVACVCAYVLVGAQVKYTNNFLDIKIGGRSHRNDVCWGAEGVPSLGSLEGIVAL